MKTIYYHIVIVLWLLAGASTAVAADAVNVYSARQEALIKPLLDRFSRDTGVAVNLVTGKADALLARLEFEGDNSPADVLITTDAGRLHRAKSAGLLQKVSSQILHDAIPRNYRDPDGYWFGLSVRARVIMAVTPAPGNKRVERMIDWTPAFAGMTAEAGTATGMTTGTAASKAAGDDFSTYESLASPALRGRLCIRSSSNIYNQSLTASMIAAHGERAALEWARGLVANFARTPTGGDRDQILAAAGGLCDIAVANTYYLAMMLSGDDARHREAARAMTVIWPNQNGRGAHVNVSGAGVTRTAANRDGATATALRLIEYLASAPAQRWYAEVNHEYPVSPNVEANPTLKNWGTFKRDPLNLATLGELNAAAVKLMDKAGWE